MLELLTHWGISDLKSLAALPEVPLTERLGQQGLHLQRLAKGETQRELVPAEPPLAFRESMELEEPVELLEPLAFLLNRLLEQVMRRLRERSLATDHLQLELTLEVHPEQQLRADSLLYSRHGSGGCGLSRPSGTRLSMSASAAPGLQKFVN